MKRYIRSNTAEYTDKWYPDDHSYKGLKETDFVTNYSNRRSTRVFVARDGSLWYRSMNGWARTYASPDYIYFSPTRAHSGLYSYLKASSPEDVAEYNRIAQEKLEELANNDKRGY